MDDDLSPLEAELKGLRPAPLPRSLIARLERELEPAEATVGPVRAGRTWWLWAAALPVAAALVVTLIVASRRESAKSPAATVAAQPAQPTAIKPETAEFKPVAAENVLYAVRDEGFVTLEDGTAARRERLNYVDTITWRNPRTNASVRWTVPREEVRIVPVKFQ